MGDEEAGETVADLPRFEADVEAIREADLRAAAAAASARGDPTGAGAPRLGNGRPRITTTAPWAMGARPAPPARQRRTAAPWAPPAPGKPGTSPEKRSGVGLRSVSELGKSLPPHQSATTAPLPPPPPPPQAFLDNCPGLSDRRSSLRVEAMTYGALFGGDGTDDDGCPVVVPVFQRTYCWTDEQVAGWWRDAFQGGGRAAEPAADRLAHGTGRCLFRKVLDAADDGREPRESLLCLDGQQRSTTTQLALAAVRDAVLALVNEETSEVGAQGGAQEGADGDAQGVAQGVADVDALIRRIEAALWVPGDDADGWIQSASAADLGASHHPPFVEGAVPTTLRPRLVPSWVDRASFFECITAGAVHHRARGSPGGDARAAGSKARYSAGTASTPMGRAKALLDAKAADLVRVGDRAASIAALRDAVDAALAGTKLIYIEVKGDDVDLAQAFQWLQEKSLFAGSILWNPAPGVDFSACDLVRNALVATTLRLPLREQEAWYRAAWLDLLQRRLRDGGSPRAFDALLNAFLVAEDSRRERDGARIAGVPRGAVAGVPRGAVAAARAAALAAADGTPVGPRYVSATERDFGAMMESDAVPEKFKKGAGPGSPMWVYCRFRSYVEEVALGAAGVDPTSRRAKKPSKPRNFDITTSAPPPEEDDEDEDEKEKEKENSGTGGDGDGLWGGVEGARDGGEDGSDAVLITEEVTRVVLARVVEYAERNGHFAE